MAETTRASHRIDAVYVDAGDPSQLDFVTDLIEEGAPVVPVQTDNPQLYRHMGELPIAFPADSRGHITGRLAVTAYYAKLGSTK